MRNVLFALLIFLSAIVTASAQETLSFGPVVGVNFAKISNSSEADTEFNTGFAAGAQLTYSNENNWGLGGWNNVLPGRSRCHRKQHRDFHQPDLHPGSFEGLPVLS